MKNRRDTFCSYAVLSDYMRVSVRIALAKFRTTHGPAEVRLHGVCAVFHLRLEQVLCIYRPSFRIHFCF
jgi:hypothetical protein